MKTIMICLSMLITVCTLAGEKENKEVKKAIQENIKLLESDNIELFFRNMIHPEEASKKHMKIDSKFIKRFKRNKKVQLLDAFKKVEKETPVFSSKTIVSYELEGGKRGRYLNFKLYNGKWYLSNSSMKIKK